MTRSLSSIRFALFATGLVLGLSGCQHESGGAGSADPHHYTAAEARAAFMQHMGAGTPHGAPPAHVPAPGNGSAGKTDK
jgi:hypothetical protein